MKIDSMSIDSMSVYEREDLIEKLQAANDANARAKFEDMSKELLDWFDGDICKAIAFVVKFQDLEQQKLSKKDQETIRQQTEIQKKKDEVTELKRVDQRGSVYRIEAL